MMHSKEFFLILGSRLIVKDLHYGYVPPNQHLSYNLGDFIKAQENYRDFILQRIKTVLKDYKNPRILEVGPGTGQLMITLLQQGYDVDGVMPSQDLINECYKNFQQEGLPKPYTIYNNAFQDLYADSANHGGPYDLIIFSESFQYIPTESSLKTCNKLLKPKGKIIILDCFKSEAFDPNDPKTKALGGGRSIKETRKEIKQLKFHIVTEQDITKETAYTIGCYKILLDNLISMPWKEFLSEKYPWLYKIYKYFIFPFLRKTIEKKQYKAQLLDVEAYKKYKQYLYLLLEKS